MQKKQIFLVLIFIYSLIFFSDLPAQEKYIVNTEKSSLKWIGEKFTGIHYGRIYFTQGELILQNNKITGGSFVIDMESIEIDDLEKDKWYDKFLSHLNSESFFDTESHPKSQLNIIKSIPLSDSTAKIFAILEIKGIKNNIEFIASYNLINNRIHAKTKLIVDRKKYNIGYGNESFFDRIGDGFLFDQFQLEVNIILNQR
jgi:polyisoprenoid-binding protein YceI